MIYDEMTWAFELVFSNTSSNGLDKIVSLGNDVQNLIVKNSRYYLTEAI